MPSDHAIHEVVIRPNRAWLQLNLRELWEYRDLVLLLVRRDFLSKYAQTLLGPIWFIVQPLITSLLFTVVFGRIAKVNANEVPHLIFYLCGFLPWNYFNNTFNSTASTFLGNFGIFSKVYFPRLAVPISVSLSNLISLAIQAGSFAGFWIYFKFFTESGKIIEITPVALFLPLLILQTALLAVGGGLYLSVLTARYRDLQHLTPVVLQCLLYISPIIFPLSSVGNPNLRLLLTINPVTSIVECFRWSLLGPRAASIHAGEITYSVVFTVVFFLVGMIFFQRAERTVVDTV